MSGAALFNNNHDGANYQAQAVLALLRYLLGDSIEESFDEDREVYLAEPRVTRFDNCREQGYTVYMTDYRGKESRQINIAFYEHRNSDIIAVRVSDKRTFNAPVASDLFTGEGTPTPDFEFGPCEINAAATFIADTMKSFWLAQTTNMVSLAR